jgi:hypothetical protein
MKMHGSEGHRYTTAISILSVVLAIATLMAGMAGCTNRPAVNAIEIRTWYDLYAIGNNMSANYVLVNDLDANTAGYEALAGPMANGGKGKGWKPIVGVNESQPDYFTGVFDGQGHKIKDLFINRTDEGRVGLFSWANLFGVIRNVGLVNATVTGGERVGALAGQVSAAFVSNCYFTGTVTADSYVGGLVGGIWVSGAVSNCHATGSVTGNYSVGGLVGYISEGDVTVTDSYSTGSVTGNERVGGLAGWNYGGTVTDCYATGSVTGGMGVGGLVGWNQALVTDSYATGSVTGGTGVGGLVGEDFGTVTNCHATGNVTGLTYIGGLAGTTNNVTDSYATGKVTGSQQVGGLAGNAHNVSNCYATGDVTGTGRGAIGGLVGFHDAGTMSCSYATGNVTGNYSGGLVGVNGHIWLSWGHPMALSDNDTVAIYYSYSTGSVTGSICVGGLVGENYFSTAVVGYSYSTGSATANNKTGGLVGFNAGNVTESYSTGSVTGNYSVGGLVGLNWHTVSNSFWDTETSGQNASAGGTGKNTTEMKDITTFSGVSWNITAVANTDTRNPAYVWNIVDAVTYPFLSWQPI